MSENDDGMQPGAQIPSVESMSFWKKLTHVLRGRKVFISYRRKDSAGYAAQLNNALRQGYREVFLDYQKIPAGAKWQDVLEARLAQATVVLAVIGPDWVDETGHDRLRDPADWVRREIELALTRADEVEVVPVLVGGATMPNPEDLPDELRALLDHQAFEVRPDRGFDKDVENLVESIGGWRRRWLGLSAYGWPAALVVAGFAAFVFFTVVDALGTDNLPPVVIDPEVELIQNGTLEIDLLAEATDDSREPLTAKSSPKSEQGGVVIDLGGGRVSYKPGRDFRGDDRFGFEVADGDGGRTEGTVFITVLPGPMRGDYNVAVVTFTEVDTNGNMVVTERSRDLSDDVFERIERELTALNEERGFGFEVRGPADAGSLSGQTHERLTTAAEDLAVAIDADVIVYGTLGHDAFTPEFFIQARGDNLRDAEELTGDYPLGSRILGSAIGAGSITDNATVRRTLQARIDALTQFIIGLSWYASRDYGEALAAFEAADSPDWNNEDGKEILHLFKGNAAGNLGELEAAAEEYELALTLNEEYARALIGRATVSFLISKKDCEQDNVDEVGLRTAAASYEQAMAAEEQPAISNIATKASFGLGRVHVCLSQALIEDRWADAEAEFQKVVNDFERGNESVRDLAVESYAGLAIISLPFEGDPHPGPSLCRALSYYEIAADLSDDPEQIATFDPNRRFVEKKVQELGVTCPGSQ